VVGEINESGHIDAGFQVIYIELYFMITTHTKNNNIYCVIL